MRTMAARLFSRSAASTKPKDDGGTSGVMFGNVTPCKHECTYDLGSALGPTRDRGVAHAYSPPPA